MPWWFPPAIFTGSKAKVGISTADFRTGFLNESFGEKLLGWTFVTDIYRQLPQSGQPALTLSSAPTSTGVAGGPRKPVRGRSD